MRVVLLALLVLNVAFAVDLPSSSKAVTPPGGFSTYADFNCAGPSQTSVCFCPNIWSMKPINPVYAVPDMNITSYDTVSNYRYFFQAPVLRYGATPGVPQNSSGGGPWMHYDTTKPCYWNTNTGEVKCSFRLRATPSASSTYLGSTTITSNSLTSVPTALTSNGVSSTVATAANSGYSVGGNLTLTTTLVSGAAGLAAAAGYSARDQLIFAELANPVTLIIRRAWEYPAVKNNIPDMKQGPSDPVFLFANRVSQSYSRYKKLTGADNAWHMALWGADNPVATKVAIDLYFDMLTCDTTPPTPNGGGTPEEVCLDVVPQVKKYCPPAQTSTQVSSNTNAVALSFTSTGC